MDEESSSPDFSPPKNKRGKLVNPDKKILIINIYQDLKKTNPKIKYKDLIAIIIKKTGIGIGTVKSTISEYKNKGTISSPTNKKNRLTILEKLTITDKTLIKKKVHELWMSNEIPTVRDLLKAIDKDGNLPKFKAVTLWKILKLLDFKFSSPKTRTLVEKDFIIAWRQKYIANIRQFRLEGRQIYYLDETWVNLEVEVNEKQSSPIPSTSHASQSGLVRKVKPFLLFHIGSINGFVSGALLCQPFQNDASDYHDEICTQMFLEWFDKTLPLLAEKSIIIMDNVPGHSEKVEIRPNHSWLKEEIIGWLKKKGYKVPENFIKNTLIQISREILINDSYLVDELTSSYGKVILRIPPFHSDLNPMELVWSKVREHFKNNRIICPGENIQVSIQGEIDRVIPMDWTNFVAHTIEVENKFDIMDQFIETFEITEYESDYSLDDDE